MEETLIRAYAECVARRDMLHAEWARADVHAQEIEAVVTALQLCADAPDRNTLLPRLYQQWMANPRLAPLLTPLPPPLPPRTPWIFGDRPGLDEGMVREMMKIPPAHTLQYAGYVDLLLRHFGGDGGGHTPGLLSKVSSWLVKAGRGRERSQYILFHYRNHGCQYENAATRSVLYSVQSGSFYRNRQQWRLELGRSVSLTIK